jgi:hypothetical protein
MKSSPMARRFEHQAETADGKEQVREPGMILDQIKNEAQVRRVEE